MNSEIRTFIAAKIPESALDSIHEFQKNLKHCFKDVRWINKESLHITIRFLGNIKAENMNLLFEIMDKTLDDFSIININLTDLGIFPDERRPRVLVAGLDGDISRLGLIESEIIKNFSDFGFEGNKKHFFPHLTIGRFNNKKNSVKDISELIKKHSPGINGRFVVDEIVFYQSLLGEKGPEYIPLHTTKLKN